MKIPDAVVCLMLAATAPWAAAQAPTAPAATGAPVSAGTLSHDAIVARYADADSHFVVLDGVNIHYKDQGNGPAVLLVHGSVGDLGDWDGWVRVLSTRYRVIRLDLPSFGLSGGVPSGNYSIDRYLTLVDSLMDHLGVPQFALVGTSYGGLVAFRYAATRLERVSALILMNSAGIEYGGRGGRVERPRDPAATFTPRVATTESMSGLLNNLINDPDKVTPALVARKTDFANVIDRDRESFLGVQLYERGDPLRVLAHVRAPALVLWGGNSKGLSPETAQAFVDGLKNSPDVRKVIYAGGGHLMHLERPEATVADALAFLDAHPGAGGLGAIPFWAASAGWWQSDNTYLDGAMNYNERAYNSIVQVEIDGRQVRETEYKFYAPGKLAAAYGRGRTTPEEGIEVVTTTVGEQIDAAGTVRITQVSPKQEGTDAMTIAVLSRDTAVRTVPNAQSGVDSYRMFITLPTQDRRHVANLGIVSTAGDAHGAPGDLRGFSLFRGQRIAAKEFERRRAELRQRNSVHAIVVAGPDGAPAVRRLD
jgi:pimeloyl-ACP methyl ester carboxylesterase